MTTYNTGNAIGSTDPRDLYDNAQNLDTAMHTPETTWTDRLGNARQSWAGATGYQQLGDYAAGIQVTTYNQVIRASGEYWRAAAGTALPYTTTGVGMPESGKFVSVGDATLRADLVAAGGSDIVGFQQAGAGAVVRTAQDKMREWVSVKDFGASSAATAAANLAAFKAAAAAVTAGGKLFVPVDSASYSIDTSGGLSSAVEINKPMEVVIEGAVKATYGTMQANPPYLFNVTAAGVTFSGSGSLIGDGTIDDTNAGDITTFPGLVRVAADDFTMFGLTIESPPKVGVALVSCERAKIVANTFKGGPSAYTIGNTAHFGIYSSGGGFHAISENHFVPDVTGGIFTNCVFFDLSSQCRIAGNLAKWAWEKIAYLYGDYNIVANNTYIAPAGGNYTDAYRLTGSYNKLIGNTSRGAKGGCQVFDGSANEIINNNFIDCTQAGIIVSHSGGAYAGGFSFTKVIGNTVIGGAGTRTDGIRILVDAANSSNILISENIVIGMADGAGEGLIRVMALSPYSVSDVLVARNNLSFGANGIYLDRVINSIVSGSIISNCTNYPIVESGGAYNKFSDNKGRANSNIGISGLSGASYGAGNQWTDANLTGTLTCSAAVTTVVTHGGVAPNARVFLQTASNSAGVMIVVKGWPTTYVSGTDFALSMANGTAASGGEVFYYQIVQ